MRVLEARGYLEIMETGDTKMGKSIKGDFHSINKGIKVKAIHSFIIITTRVGYFIDIHPRFKMVSLICFKMVSLI